MVLAFDFFMYQKSVLWRAYVYIRRFFYGNHMVDNTVIEAIVIGGAILGGIGRQMLPYIRQLASAEETGQPLKYQHRYTFTTIFSVIVAAVVGMTLFPNLLQNVPANGPIASVFISSFLTAWGSASLFANVAATGNGTGSGGTTNPPAVAKKSEDVATT
jgi:hypothetical protein